MSNFKEWPELVGKSFEQASAIIKAFDAGQMIDASESCSIDLLVELNPYNARNGVENRMYDPVRVVCVTDDNDVVTVAPKYNLDNK
jgi:hypothetical protein